MPKICPNSHFSNGNCSIHGKTSANELEIGRTIPRAACFNDLYTFKLGKKELNLSTHLNAFG